MRTSDAAFKHWSLGIEYARTVLNWTLSINTAAIAAAVGLRTNVNVILLKNSHWFGIGITLCLMTYVFAYFTQLNYGNAELALDPKRARTLALVFHRIAYFCLTCSLISTGVGIVFSTLELSK